MPLSEPAPREPIHTRRIECRGFERADGLWDIEARLTDVKSYEIPNDWRGKIAAGEPLHDMWVRLTLDDRLVVQAVETTSDATPFSMCGDITPNFQAIVGLRVAPGWHRRVKERVGGVHGCTHIVELIGAMATAAFQTIYPKLRSRKPRDERDTKRPLLLDTCHAWASSSPVVERYYPDWYDGN